MAVQWLSLESGPAPPDSQASSLSLAGIPTLIVLDPQGEVIKEQASQIMSEAVPLPITM